MKKTQLFTTGRILSAACLGIVAAFGASADDVTLSPTDQGRINLTNGNTRAGGLSDGRTVRAGTNANDFLFEGFMVFDTAGVAGPLNSASLDFEIGNIVGSPGGLQVYGVSSAAGFDTSLDNTELNSMVTNGGALIQNLGSVGLGTLNTNVTAFVNAQRVAGNSTVGFLFKHDPITYDGVNDQFQIYDSNDGAATQFPELNLSSVIAQPQVAPVISVTDRSPNGGVDRDLSSTLGTVTATPNLPTTTYAVELDFSSVGGGIETIAFDLDYSRSGGTGLQYNTNGNVGVTGSNNDNYVDDLEQLTVAASLNNAQTTYSGAVDIRLDTIFTELAGANNVFNYLYSISGQSFGSGGPGITAEFTMPAEGNFFESDAVTIDPFVAGTEIALEGVKVDLFLNGLPDIFSAYSFGDADGDGDVDNADLGAAAGNFTGSSGSGKNWATGDFDADGDTDNADIGVVAGGFTGAQAGNLTDSGNIADLRYDPTTGNITLDASEAAGAVITSFQLENGTNAFIAGNYNSLVGGTFGGAFEDVSDSVAADSDLTFVGLGGLLDLGNIAPTGLDLAQLEALLTNAVYVGSLGSGNQTFDLVVIPEPTSLALLALGGLFMSRRRRG